MKRARKALLLVALLALVAAACGDSGESDGTYPTITVAADASQASPRPETGEATGEQAAYDSLDLAALGPNASSSGVPSAVPAGLEVGFTEEGYPYRGSPDAPVTLIEYSDYACPFCGRYTSQTAPSLLEQYGTTDQVRFIFREFPLVGLHPTAPVAHAVAVCSGEQSADFYWAVHDEIFSRQDAWTSLPDPTEVVAGFAQSVGVDTTALQECLASGRATEVIDAGVATAQSFGFNGTPSFQLNGEGVEGTYDIIGAQPVDTFQAYIDALLAGEAPSDPAPEPGEEPEPPGLPYWADVTTGLQPDPDRPGVNLAGDYYKGDPEAPVVVIEFSDFQCPFCRDHALEVQPTIDERFIATGDVLWVYKHLPLGNHPLAPTAGAAAECAGDQGKFWEMHELLFESVEQWETGETEAEIVALAGELGLDTAAFETCFNGRDALQRVLADAADAEGIVAQTPSFVFIIGERGALMEGSLPVDQFVASLEARLQQAAEVSGSDG